jgi:hypothetical protein
VLDSGVEPHGAFVGSKEVGLQRGARDNRAGAVDGDRFGLQRMDSRQQITVPVEERAIDPGFSELVMIMDMRSMVASLSTSSDASAVSS